MVMYIMSKLALIVAGGVAAAAVTMSQIDIGPERAQPAPDAAVMNDSAQGPPSYVPKVMLERAPVEKGAEEQVMVEAARSAWAFIDKGYVPKTGLVAASPDWPYPTIWDIASTLGAFYSARDLGFITDAEYQKRTRQLLETMKVARLYKGIGYGRNYDARTGELVGLDQKPSQDGTGYSTIDLGRFLIWLKVVANDNPELAPLAKQVATRLNTKAIIKGGYFHGEQVLKTGIAKYQEGRLGYEQYSAAGFALWGMRADKALNAKNNIKKVTIEGVPIYADKRGLDRMLSEPYIMHGLEVGLSGDMAEMAWQTLALQALRYEKTKQVTMASEDALNDKPYYFYYYCVYCSGKPYAINVHKPGINLDEPRWMSSKAAFAWHALLPSKYTWLAVNAVMPAHVPGKGWATGVYEKSNKSTEVMSLNTAALILESASYYKTGKPFLKRAG